MRRTVQRSRVALARLKPILQWGAAAVGVALLGLLLFLVLWRVPEQHVAAVAYSGPSVAHDRMQDENATRATLAQIIGGGVLLIGLYFTAKTVQIAQRDVHATEEGKITDRFSKAVEQLGSDRLEIQLGGIYALERVARDSAPDHWPVMEVLTTYVREHAPYPPKVQRQTATPSRHRTAEPRPKPSQAATSTVGAKDVRTSADIQAILTVIGRRQRTFGHGEEQSLDLHATNLQRAILHKSQLERANLVEAGLYRADLNGAMLRGADLVGADLIEADLTGAILAGADLVGADLSRAILSGATLNRATLHGADLRGAILRGAILSGADLTGADLSGADLHGADLTGADNLTMEQLQSAITSETTKVPDYLLSPVPAPESTPTEEPDGS